MIKADKGHTQIEGNKIDIMCDLSYIIEALKDHFSAEDIKFAVDLGLKSDEEIDKVFEDLDGFMAELSKTLKKHFE